MIDEKYNGWTNYETWAVALWIDNDHSSYLYWREQAQRRHEEAKSSDIVLRGVCSAAQAAMAALAEQLQAEITDASPLSDATLYTDLLNAAFGEVDWYDIAQSLLADEVALDDEEATPIGKSTTDAEA